MRVKFFVFSVLMMLMIKTNAQRVAGALTLQQAIETALKNNTEVKQSEFAMQTERVGYNQAKGNLLPDVTGIISHGINQGRSIDPFTNSYIKTLKTKNLTLIIIVLFIVGKVYTCDRSMRPSSKLIMCDP